jgi:quercetin dioxygenase-like cupin family protein
MFDEAAHCQVALAAYDEAVRADPERTLRWPDGTIYRITRSTDESDGAELVMEWELPAGGWAPQAHVHPGLTERYEVLDGSFEVLLGDSWRELAAGQSVVVPQGTVHAFRTGHSPARVRNVHRPALDFEPYIKALCRTANARNLGDLSGPRTLLYLALLIEQYPLHSRAPGRLLNAAVGPLAALARAGRLRPA